MVGQTIEAAAKQLRTLALIASFKTWRELDVAGRFIATEVLGGITDSDCFIADVSVLNFNVVYELGFAIGSRKKIVLVRFAGIEDDNKKLSELGIFDTIGWKNYENSSDLVGVIRNVSDLGSIDFSSERINEKAPVYLLDGKFKTDPLVRIVSRVKKAKLFFRSFDPNESQRMSALNAVSNVAQSHGVIVSLLPSEIVDHEYHNLRAAFVAGLAAGMGKHLCFIQFGDEPVPIDYRDIVTVCRHPTQIDEAIAEFAPQVTLAFQGEAPALIAEPRTFLERLHLGASAAENEFQNISEYYVETDAFRRALRGEVRVVLGRKGSGKSALFAHLRNVLRRNRQNIVIDLKPESYKLIKFKEDIFGLLTEGALDHLITAFWEYVLLLEVAHKLLEKDRVVHTRDPSIYEPYRDLSELYDADEFVSEGDFSERMSQLISRIQDDFRSRFGSKVTSLTQAQVTELLYKHDIRELRENICEYLKIKDQVWLIIDNVDKGWQTHGIKRTDLIIIRTLLESTRKIEREFNSRDIFCKSIVCLRNDVYELLVGETPDRGKETKVLLDWTDADSLRELLRRRLIVNDLSSDTDFMQVWRSIAATHVDGEESCQFLIDRSLMRPRELIDCLNHCRGFAINRGHNKIEEEDFRDGIKVHSRDLIQEISYEIRDIWSMVEDIIYMFMDAERTISEEGLQLLFIDFNITEEYWEQVTELLLWYGVLGIFRDNGDPVYIYDLSYDIKLLKTLHGKTKVTVFEINPAFHAGLEI